MRATISLLILALLPQIAQCAPQTTPNENTQTQQTLEIESLHNLAVRLRAEQHYREARPVYERALEVAQDAYGSNDPRLVVPLNSLALIERDMGEYKSATESATRALSILAAHQLSNTAAAADSLLVAGTVYQTDGQLEEARKALERAADIRLKLYGRDDPRVAEVWSSLGIVYRNQGKQKRAETFYRMALTALEKQDPQGERAAILNNLARALADRGHWQDAIQCYRQAITAWEALHGPDHPKVALGLTNLASVLAQHKQETEAEALLQRALDISQRHLPPGDAEIGRELASLGAVRAKMGYPTEAAGLFARGIAILTSAWGADNPLLVPWLEVYTKFLHKQEDYAAAEQVRLQATRIRVVNTLRNGR